MLFLYWMFTDSRSLDGGAKPKRGALLWEAYKFEGLEKKNMANLMSWVTAKSIFFMNEMKIFRYSFAFDYFIRQIPWIARHWQILLCRSTFNVSQILKKHWISFHLSLAVIAIVSSPSANARNYFPSLVLSIKIDWSFAFMINSTRIFHYTNEKSAGYCS